MTRVCGKSLSHGQATREEEESKDPQCPSRKHPQRLKTSYQTLVSKLPTTQPLTCGWLGNILETDHGRGGGEGSW